MAIGFHVYGELVGGMSAPSPEWHNSSSFFGQGHGSIFFSKESTNSYNCWSASKVRVSSMEQATGVHTNKHYGVLCCDSCRKSVDISGPIEVLSDKESQSPS